MAKYNKQQCCHALVESQDNKDDHFPGCQLAEGGAYHHGQQHEPWKSLSNADISVNVVHRSSVPQCCCKGAKVSRYRTVYQCQKGESAVRLCEVPM